MTDAPNPNLLLLKVAQAEAANARALMEQVKVLKQQNELLASTLHALGTVTAAIPFALKDAGVDITDRVVYCLESASNQSEHPKTKSILRSLAKVVQGPPNSAEAAERARREFQVIVGGLEPDNPEQA